MDFGDTLKNPTTLMVGAAIGLVVLLSRHASAPPVQVNSVTPGFTAQAQYVLAANKNALDAQVELAGINGNIAVSQINATVADHSYAFAMIKNANDAATTLAVQRDQSLAGIINSAIAANTAVAVDASNNQTRTTLGYIDAAKTRTVVQGQVQIEQIKSNTAKALAKTSLIGSIFGSVAKVASVALAPATGGASLGAGALIGGGNNNGGSIQSSPILNSALGQWT